MYNSLDKGCPTKVKKYTGDLKYTDDHPEPS